MTQNVQAATLQRQAYDHLTKGGAYAPDLPIKHPIGQFVRLVEAGVTRIEDASSDLSDLIILNEDGKIYKASVSQAREVE